MDQMNEWGNRGTPYFFLIDYALVNAHVYTLDHMPEDVSLSFKGLNIHPPNKKATFVELVAHPPSKSEYSIGFEGIIKAMKAGGSYLCNYTCSVPVSTSSCLSQIYNAAESRYKLKFKNEFVCFSPETFIRIEDNQIFTFPMKGTAPYTSEKSLQCLLENQKEKAEHYTVVDLLRNDLSKVCNNVRVNRLRYPSYVNTKTHKLIQLSSEISGNLRSTFRHQHGQIIKELLPAGSICGAPKESTVNLIHKYEGHDRGYYTGIFGVFDGRVLESAVAIRFIQDTENGLVYKTGGGLTAKSQLDDEYDEMKNKIYVPIP